MAARFNCLRCGRRLDRTVPAETSEEAGQGWAGDPRSYYDGVNLCPRCAEWHSARERIWNMALAALVFVSMPVGVVALNALR